jgi:outer membrane lipoprotein
MGIAATGKIGGPPMHKGCCRSVLLLTAVFLITACAGGISQQARDKITYFGPFAAVRQEPQKHVGEIMLWGGRIIATQVDEGVTEIVVLQQELGSRDRPQDNDQSQGRFLIRSHKFLDPALYPAGMLVTVVGRLQGTETRLIGKMPYVYPVVDPIEIKKWPAGVDSSPRIHFGIGIGTHF